MRSCMRRIGILYPSAGVSEAELQRLLPADVSLHVTRIPMSTPSTRPCYRWPSM